MKIEKIYQVVRKNTRHYTFGGKDKSSAVIANYTKYTEAEKRQEDENAVKSSFTPTFPSPSSFITSSYRVKEVYCIVHDGLYFELLEPLKLTTVV